MIDQGRVERDDLIQGYLSEAMGLPGARVLPGKESSPADNDVYATYIVVSNIPVGLDTVRFDPIPETDDSVVTYSSRGQRLMHFSVQAYRTGANDHMRRLLSYHYSPLGQLAIERAGMTFNKVGRVRELSGIQSASFEERFGVDIYFTVPETVSQAVNTLASAEITVDISDAADITQTTEVIA